MAIPDRYVFDGLTINNVYIKPIAAFTHEDLWVEDLIARVIPELGEKYMELFIDCKFNIGSFLKVIQTVDID